MAATRKPTSRSRARSARKATARSRSGEAHLRSLERVAGKLEYAQVSFADSLLRLPRAEEYEPLVAPLREFARISPALVEALRGVVESARTLGAAVAALEEAGQRRPAAPIPMAGGPAGDEARLDQARLCVEAASEAVRSALAELPGDADYAPVASQLRELATVSPSLMEWLREVPRLATPLRGSVQALRRALDDLETARALLRYDPGGAS